MQGPKQVRAVLGELQLLPETVLVIRNDALVTEDELVADTDTIEIRPVISGGADWSGGAGRSSRTPRHAV
jgi:sulfur carrier protein